MASDSAEGYGSRRARTRGRTEGPVRYRTSFRNTIIDVFKARGWREAEGDMDWDINWADREWVYDVFDHVHLDHWQRVNHYRNGRELCRKDLLIKNLKRMRRTLEREGRQEEAKEFDFWPSTYVLPGDYALFVEEFKRSHGTGHTWIMKPIGRSQGKGIFLFTKLSQVSDWKTDGRWRPSENPQAESYVVQKYISSPLLVGGKKFDLRIYALVTNFAPLTVYLYRAGFARFTNARYDLSNSDLFVHLTNVAIQKTSSEYDRGTGGKWLIRDMKLYLVSRYGSERVEEAFLKIQRMVINSLKCVAKAMINDKHCFELYGYDIMFDSKLKPWLIEVNASPSLSANTSTDYDLKFQMLYDAMDVLQLEKVVASASAMEARRERVQRRVGGFDLIHHGEDVHPPAKSVFQTFLGCDYKLDKATAARARGRKQRPKKAAGKSTPKRGQQRERAGAASPVGSGVAAARQLDSRKPSRGSGAATPEPEPDRSATKEDAPAK